MACSSCFPLAQERRFWLQKGLVDAEEHFLLRRPNNRKLWFDCSRQKWASTEKKQICRVTDPVLPGCSMKHGPSSQSARGVAWFSFMLTKLRTGVGDNTAKVLLMHFYISSCYLLFALREQKLFECSLFTAIGKKRCSFLPFHSLYSCTAGNPPCTVTKFSATKSKYRELGSF